MDVGDVDRTKSGMNASGAHQIVLILDDDVMVTDGLSAALARAGRTLVTCNDLEAGELIVEWLHPSHVVSDVRLTGQFAYEGLDFIRFVKRHSPDTRIILMTGDAPDALQLEASERGAVGFLRKPFEVADLDSVLDMMAPFREGSSEWPEIMTIPVLDKIISGSTLSTVFQPIVRLSSGDRLGYESLARYETESPMRNPEILFKYAQRKQQVGDLEIACIRNSLVASADLPGSLPIFLNTHPEVFASGTRFVDALVASAEKAGVAFNRIVLEITEQASLGDGRKSLDTIARLKEIGVRFAFDDLGIAYSHLPFMDEIRPSFLKVSQFFGTGFEDDPTKTKIVRNVLALAKDFDCGLILEGIETAATAAAAGELGIKYGQGYYFARPAEASVFATLDDDA